MDHQIRRVHERLEPVQPQLGEAHLPLATRKHPIVPLSPPKSTGAPQPMATLRSLSPTSCGRLPNPDSPHLSRPLSPHEGRPTEYPVIPTYCPARSASACKAAKSAVRCPSARRL